MQAFITRPVMALAINLVVFIIGLVAFGQLPLRHNAEIPSLDIQVYTTYPGANAGIVEQRVTKPLEDALSGVDGIKRITSESQDSASNIHITFKADGNYHLHLSQVRDKLLATKSELPDEVQPFRIHEMKDNGPTELIYLSFTDTKRSSSELYDFVHRDIVERLKLIEGVANIREFGERPYQIEVAVDPLRLAELNLSIKQITDALKREKAFATGGEVEAVTGKKTVVISAVYRVPSDMQGIHITDYEGIPIYLSDVADIRVTHKKPDFILRTDGQEVIGLAISAKPQANPMDVASDVQTFIKKLRQEMPESLSIEVLLDNTQTFSRAIDSVYSALIEAVVLVGVIVTLCLASLRAAVVPMVTVPLCLVASFAFMAFFNFSINPITLLAMVLAVGLVVDDAIVVVENIHKHMESGLNSINAAKKGMKEITFAVIVMTITLAAVYLPIAFQKDPSAYMFREFAWTLAGSVLISGFVALTLTPAMCGLLLRPVNNQSKAERIWKAVNQTYHHWLSGFIEHPTKVLLIGFMVAVLGVWGVTKLPSELKPVEDEDYLFGWMAVENQVSDKVSESWAKAVEGVVKDNVPERTRLLTMRYQDHHFWVLLLKPRAERDIGADQIVTRLQGPLNELPGPMYGVGQNGGGNGGTEDALSLIIQYTGDFNVLTKSVKQLVNQLNEMTGVSRAESQEIIEKTRIKVSVHRKLAAKLGVRVLDIEEALYAFFSGTKTLDFTYDGYDYPVYVRAGEEARTELKDLNHITVSSKVGQAIPLSTLVSIEEILEPSSFNHYERIRSATVTVFLQPDWPIDEALKTIEPLVKKNIPEHAHYKMAGQAEEYQEAKVAMLVTFLLALAFIYLVLAALFESFVDPFIVLLTVPLSVVGAVFAIKAMGGSNNIYMQVGLITLIGLITKHGILITDFANKLRQSGKSVKEAAVRAAVSRLRPILMTTFAMICGATPLVLSVGAGANARAHIGWVIIGGMITGTLFSLFVIPVVYMVVAKARNLLSTDVRKLVQEYN